MDTNYASGASPNPAPITLMSEAEMKTMHSIFARAADTIVEASRLAVEVRELSQTVNALKTEVEAFRSRNNWLDEQLTSTRTTRDEALAQVTQLKAQVGEIERENVRLLDANDRLDKANGDLQDRLALQIKENRALADANDSLHTIVASAQERLNKMHDAIGVPRVVLNPPKAEPEPVRSEPFSTQAIDGAPKPYSHDTDPAPQPTEGDRPWWQTKATA